METPESIRTSIRTGEWVTVRLFIQLKCDGGVLSLTSSHAVRKHMDINTQAVTENQTTESNHKCAI